MATATARPTGWAAVNGWLGGLADATETVGGIVDTVADGAEDIARGKAAISNQMLDKQQREQDMALQLAGFARGDNVQLYYVIGAAAVAVILLMK